MGASRDAVPMLEPPPLSPAEAMQANILFRHIQYLRLNGRRLALVNTETLKVGTVEREVDILRDWATLIPNAAP